MSKWKIYYRYIKLSGCICVCLSVPISITAEPIWFSFKIKLPIGPGKVYNYFGGRLPLPCQLFESWLLFRLFSQNDLGISCWSLHFPKSYTTEINGFIITRILHQIFMLFKWNLLLAIINIHPLYPNPLPFDWMNKLTNKWSMLATQIDEIFSPVIISTYILHKLKKKQVFDGGGGVNATNS